MTTVLERHPKMVRFQLRLKVVTDKAVGVLFEEDDEADEIKWLPFSSIAIHNEWKHGGETWISGKLPVWLGRKIGIASAYPDEKENAA